MKKLQILILIILVSCTPITTTPVETTPTQIEPSTVTETVVVKETFIPYPTLTATTEPSITATSTKTPTPYIIEITRFPVSPSPADFWQGLPDGSYFVSWSVMNVRSCPQKSCAIIDTVPAGTRVTVYAWSRPPFADEEWLCRVDLIFDKETKCSEAIALVYGGVVWGNLVLP